MSASGLSTENPFSKEISHPRMKIKQNEKWNFIIRIEKRLGSLIYTHLHFLYTSYVCQPGLLALGSAT